MNIHSFFFIIIEMLIKHELGAFRCMWVRMMRGSCELSRSESSLLELAIKLEEVEVIERHLMAIAAEDNEPAIVNDGGMSVTGGRSLVLHLAIGVLLWDGLRRAHTDVTCK